MRKSVQGLLAAIGLVAAPLAFAQGTLYVSNLGATPIGSKPVANNSQVAEIFRTGTNAAGYVFNSVQLRMNAGTGSLSGFSVALFSAGGSGPQDLISSLAGSDPASGGVFTYTAPNITLLPYAFYFIVATAATPLAQGSYIWSAGPNVSLFGLEQWALDDSYYSSSDGATWAYHVREGSPQMALYATPVPEPAACALAGLGMVALGFMRRTQRR